MLIKEEALKHWIDNFYGYGSWDAPIWFVDYEEGGGDVPQEVADKINYFQKAYPANNLDLCDIREMYKKVSFKIDGPRSSLFTNLHDYRFGPNAVQHGTWKNLIAFEHGYRQKQLHDLLTYQQNSIASKNSEALLRLYPLPAHNHAWHYSWLDLPKLDFLKSRGAYEDHVYSSRMQHILHNMNIYKPKVVLMYGMKDINKLRKSVQAAYTDTKFKMVKAVPKQMPQHHRADLPGTMLLITTQIPALRHNRVETGFDWYEFGETLKPKK